MDESLDPSRIIKGPGSLWIYVPARRELKPGEKPPDFPPQDPPEVHYMDYVANYWSAIEEGFIELDDRRIALRPDAQQWLRSQEADVRKLQRR